MFRELGIIQKKALGRIARKPGENAHSVAKAIKKDYKNTHAALKALLSYGFLERFDVVENAKRTFCKYRLTIKGLAYILAYADELIKIEESNKPNPRAWTEACSLRIKALESNKHLREAAKMLEEVNFLKPHLLEATWQKILRLLGKYYLVYGQTDFSFLPNLVAVRGYAEGKFTKQDIQAIKDACKKELLLKDIIRKRFDDARIELGL